MCCFFYFIYGILDLIKYKGVQMVLAQSQYRHFDYFMCKKHNMVSQRGTNRWRECPPNCVRYDFGENVLHSSKEVFFFKEAECPICEQEKQDA